MHNTVNDICVQVFVLTCVFNSWEYTQKWNYWSYDNSMFNIIETAKLFSKVDAQLYNPISNVWEFQFL